MAGPSGLTLLAEGASSANEGVDIIAVHGLGGYDWWKTRIAESSSGAENQTRFWLRDWVPQELAPTRIFTYDYQVSTCRDDWGIISAADELLNELKVLRADKTKKSRPLSFICHSLGGLVVKCALSRAFHNRGDELLNEIITGTQGIIFMGTPHLTSPSELYTSISRIATGTKPTEVTMVAVQLMYNIIAQFMSLPWESLPWKIVSFYEELPLPGSDLRAVDRNQTELWNFPQVSLHSSHHDMCCFTSEDDPLYVKVLESLRNITLSSDADQVTVHQTLSAAEHEVLESLTSKDASANVRDAYPNTCDWIFNHDKYKSWLEKPTKFLWIDGKPGSGKTVLVNHIAKTIPLDSTTSPIVATHFFCPSHDSEKRSMTSLLRSLLYQLLTSISSSQAFEIFANLSEKREILGSDKPWDDDVLKENLFQLTHKSTALGGSVYILIDALDECNDPDGVVSLVQFLNAASNGPGGLRICLSSRKSSSLISAWEIRMEDHNFSDIQKYVKDKLVARWNSFHRALSVQESLQIIAEKAQGVFLWAVLVVSDLLCNSNLELFRTTQQLASWLPVNLEAAYQTVLERLCESHSARKRRIAQDALILVMCAKRPLSVPELCNALEVVDEFDQTRINRTQRHMWRSKYTRELHRVDILSGLGGLLDVSPQVLKSANGAMSVPGATVRLVHETAREFLLSKGLYELDTHWIKGCTASLHFRVAQICLNYIYQTLPCSQLSITNKEVSSCHFLRYAITYGMEHLSLAGRMGVKPKTDDMWQSPAFQDGFIDRWAYVHNRLLGNQNLFKPGKTKATHIMSYFGLPWLDTGLWGVSLGDINTQDHFGLTPLSFAAAMGHLDICQRLIELGAEVNQRDHVYGQTPLILAAAHGHRDVVRCLLTVGSDPDDHTSGVSALWMAARSAKLQAVQLLLEAGASARTTNMHTGETALSRAAALGNIPIVSLLLKSGAQVENWDKRGWTPLHHAASRSKKKTLELLLGTLKEDQLHTLRASLVKAQPSWVNTVLNTIIIGLCVHQYGQSKTSPSESSQAPKGPNAPGQNRSSSASNRKRGRGKLNFESDEDACEDEDQGTSDKRLCHSNPGGRRFACPYHRRNAVKYPNGACNGKGFENIHRLKSHLKKFHSRALDWQRCHICQARFPHDNIVGHEPCVRREKPTDYEDGFDAVQLKKLMSKEMFPKRSSDEKCWYAIFKVLFPDWPENEEIPSPYQDDPTQTALLYSNQQVLFRRVRDVVVSPETIREIMDDVDRGRGEQGIRQILERRLCDCENGFGLSPIAESEQPHQGALVDSLAVPRPHSATRLHPGPTTINVASTTASPQLASILPNTGEAPSQTASGSMENYQGHYSYLPPPDQPLLEMNHTRHDGSFIDSHSSFMLGSHMGSGFYDLMHDSSGILTSNTEFSDYGSAGHGQWGNMDGSGSLSPHYESMFPMNQNIMSNFAGPSVSPSTQQQDWTQPMGPQQDNPTPLAEREGNGKSGSAATPSQANMCNQEP